MKYITDYDVPEDECAVENMEHPLVIISYAYQATDGTKLSADRSVTGTGNLPRYLKTFPSSYGQFLELEKEIASILQPKLGLRFIIKGLKVLSIQELKPANIQWHKSYNSLEASADENFRRLTQRFNGTTDQQ